MRRFRDADVLERALTAGELDEPADHTWLLQEYVEPAEGFITRVEIVGGAFLYALKADTSHGFELCPADTCEVHDEFCPTGPHAARIFDHRPDIDGLVGRYLAIARACGIEIAGFEFIEAADGLVVTYDVNTNTNYNSIVEEQAGRSGTREVARFLANCWPNSVPPAASPSPADLERTTSVRLAARRRSSHRQSRPGGEDARTPRDARF